MVMPSSTTRSSPPGWVLTGVALVEINDRVAVPTSRLGTTSAGTQVLAPGAMKSLGGQQIAWVGLGDQFRVAHQQEPARPSTPRTRSSPDGSTASAVSGP
jgi:hypothetical protein